MGAFVLGGVCLTQPFLPTVVGRVCVCTRSFISSDSREEGSFTFMVLTFA